MAYGDAVTVGGDAVALFQRPGGPATVGGQPLLVNLKRAGMLLVQFTAMAYLQAATDETAARYRYVLLVDGQPIPPSLPEIVLAPARTGTTLAVTAMPSLSAGAHRLQVVAQATADAVYVTRNQALTVTGPLAPAP